ncbi:DNA polymerase III subunit delta [Paenibacillus thermoaerophilus]|uniref:DNA polymerase III subunit delta n=1 Tax=Paenibacillus thermoaerophilus TaxID=1215385 RepID=A0ABW2UXD7_9BACL|nr:DNA polymerase III subunit delta [Paenibacillus thermoaerophilus]TMV18983.1 DNA polymerase III subunit delta [Paenibacillus thermoaerophilus]
MDYRSAAKDISRGQSRPVYVLFGSEDYLMQEFVTFAVDQWLAPEERELGLVRFDCAETPIEAVIEEANMMPFLASRKVVVATGATFLTGAKESGKVEHKPEALLSYLDSPAEHSILLLTVQADKLDERKKLVKRLKDSGCCLSFAPLDEDGLRAWTVKQAERAGFAFEPGAAERLILNAGGNLRTMASAIETIGLYAASSGGANGRARVDVEAVDSLVARTAEQNVFLLVDHAVHLRVREAMDMLRELLLQKEEPIKIAALLARQFRIMLQTKELSQQGYSPQQMASGLGLHPYAAKLAAEQARRFPADRLAELLSDLAELDFAMKTGKVDKALGLELFLLKLAS